MKYFTKMNDLKFYKDPEDFTKYTDKSVLKYAIGANMYMPATKKGVFKKLIENKFNDIGAITLCMEDAIEESMVKEAEKTSLELLNDLYKYKEKNENNNLPLIFIRVRNVNQFKEFSQMLEEKHVKMLCGFNFPKFNSLNGSEYFDILNELSLKFNEPLYGMPIIEDKQVIYKENRYNELHKIQEILNNFDKYVLNIRVGGTDFSSLFGLRRDVETTIYDIRVVSDCLIDILNYFLREPFEYVISGPVWEYFSWDEKSKEVIGLRKELKMDIQNGFQGKTIIHPSQINVVNEEYIVDYDEYMDAFNILNNEGGVFKSSKGNKMNEVSPHKNWAKKIIAKSKIFGVYDQNVR